jgi:3-oxoacyl-[acyl-carrier protein] reductase
MIDVIITGAAGAIGTETVKLLLSKREFRVVAIDSDPKKLEMLSNQLTDEVELGNLTLVINDLSDYGSCLEIVTSISGGVSRLVHLAGLNLVDADSYDNEDNWNTVVNSNLKSAYLMAGAVLENRDKKNSIRMVFTSSIAYRRGSFDSLIYSIAKAGVVGLTRSMAKRVGSEGLVNAIAPGVIDTPMSQSYIRNNLSSLEKQIPVKRVGEPIDVANLIYFLISDNCTYVTGQTINIDGGMINS